MATFGTMTYYPAEFFDEDYKKVFKVIFTHVRHRVYEKWWGLEEMELYKEFAESEGKFEGEVALLYDTIYEKIHDWVEPKQEDYFPTT